jgi:taurine dioxygenase
VVPTLFASATNAWEALPDDLREEVRELQAVNVSGPEYLPKRRTQALQGNLVQGQRVHQPSFTWPVMRVHPRTGQTLLYIGQANTVRLVGYDAEASEELIERLFSYLCAPENVFTFGCRNQDLIIWDNWCVHHGRPEVEVEGPAPTLRKIGLPIVQAAVPASLINTYRTIDTSS